MAVGTWPGLQEVEIYDITLDAWTVHPEYFLPLRLRRNIHSRATQRENTPYGYDADAAAVTNKVWT